MPLIKEKAETIDPDKIRRQIDPKTGNWCFSVVDVMGVVTETTDARNYWKVLKNRLNKTHNKLVTKCNQLKMMSKDGKSYLTDVADVETMLELVELVSPSHLEQFREWFNSPIEEQLGHIIDEAKLLVDGYQTDTEIIIKAMLAGVEPANLSVSVTSSKVTIKGTRENIEAPKNIKDEDYLNKELLWSSFARTISLPSKVNTNDVATSEDRGCLTIKLKKIN